jgi:hypothetical protein
VIKLQTVDLFSIQEEADTIIILHGYHNQSEHEPLGEFHKLCSTENYTSHELVYIAYHHADEQFGKSSVKGRIIIKCSDTDELVL